MCVWKDLLVVAFESKICFFAGEDPSAIHMVGFIETTAGEAITTWNRKLTSSALTTPVSPHQSQQKKKKVMGLNSWLPVGRLAFICGK